MAQVGPTPVVQHRRASAWIDDRRAASLSVEPHRPESCNDVSLCFGSKENKAKKKHLLRFEFILQWTTAGCIPELLASISLGAKPSTTGNGLQVQLSARQ